MEKDHQHCFGDISGSLNSAGPESIFGFHWDQQAQAAESASAHFESALSSLVSSPVTAAGGMTAADDDDIAIGDLIGRLGSICNSTTTSCYSTPLSSPPRGAHHQLMSSSPPSPFPVGYTGQAALGGLRALPVPAEAAGGRQSRATSNKTLDVAGSSPMPKSATGNNGTTRKRKAPAKNKSGKDAPFASPTLMAAEDNGGTKRSKSDGVGDGGKTSGGSESEGDAVRNGNGGAPEPPKDYIHVRVRRGQATDSHSLAERVRREKISERMKLLQSLVPGCNKVDTE